MLVQLLKKKQNCLKNSTCAFNRIKNFFGKIKFSDLFVHR